MRPDALPGSPRGTDPTRIRSSDPDATAPDGPAPRARGHGAPDDPATPAPLDEIRGRVRGILARILMVDPEVVVPEAELVGDLGAESLDFLDMLFSLEDAVGRRIPVEEWTMWVEGRVPASDRGRGITVELVVEFTREQLGSAPGPSSSLASGEES